MKTPSGRFLGADDGRVWAPTITKDAWDSLLKTCVVSEVDAIREPISAASTLGLGPVVVISNSELASRSHGLHVSFGAVLCRDLESVEIYRGATVLCLRELDCPASRTMTEARFKVLGNASAPRLQFPRHWRDLVSGALNTQNAPPARLPEKPSFGRNDTGLGASASNAKVVFYVPGVLPNQTINRRCSARTQQLTRLITLESADTGVETLSRNGELKLLDYDIGQGNKEDLSMRVTASSCDAVVYPPSTANSFPQGVHIWIGRDTASGDKLIGLSATNSPSFTVDKHQILHRRCSSTTIDADSGATQLHSIKDLWLLGKY
ncbi:hypothetical protein TrVFT333_009376 [Trichoderma virens FT-333]|nr:hypothetical protein TrVFT333_009376 [Trichoderma virens FT-333]